jgi:hypothetical protein
MVSFSCCDDDPLTMFGSCDVIDHQLICSTANARRQEIRKFKNDMTLRRTSVIGSGVDDQLVCFVVAKDYDKIAPHFGQWMRRHFRDAHGYITIQRWPLENRVAARG